MTIQRFAELLEKKENPSPVLKALKMLRTLNLDQLQGTEKLDSDWLIWSEVDAAPVPQA